MDEKGRIKWGRRGKKSGHLLPKNGSGVVGEVRKREKRGKRKEKENNNNNNNNNNK